MRDWGWDKTVVNEEAEKMQRLINSALTQVAIKESLEANGVKFRYKAVTLFDPVGFSSSTVSKYTYKTKDCPSTVG